MKEKMFDYFMQLYKEETERYEKNLKNKKNCFLSNDFLEILSNTTKRFLEKLNIEENQVFMIDTIPDKTFKVLNHIVYEINSVPQKNIDENKEAFLRITSFAQYMDENNLTTLNLIPVNQPLCICRKNESFTLNLEEIYDSSGDYTGNKALAINFKDQTICSYIMTLYSSTKKIIFKTEIKFYPFCGKKLIEN